MTQLLDPSGQRVCHQFHLFEELCIRGFLAVRLSSLAPLRSSSALPHPALKSMDANSDLLPPNAA